MSAQTLEGYRILELSRQVDEVADQLWATGKLALLLQLFAITTLTSTASSGFIVCQGRSKADPRRAG